MPLSTSLNLKQLLRVYQKHYSTLGRAHAHKQAVELAVGGDFHAAGTVEYYLLKAHGLAPSDLVVDIGCGGGRLAYQLAQRGHQRYAGFDIIESAVNLARDYCQKPDWTFAVNNGIRVPLPDGAADLVCFFSVFTHITHEHTYHYLRETSRLLRPSGTVVFSFLEFAIPSHWHQFDAALRHFGLNYEPIVFLDRAAIAQFAAYLDYDVVQLLDGDKLTIPIGEEVAWADGTVMRDLGKLGQSVAVLRKR